MNWLQATGQCKSDFRICPPPPTLPGDLAVSPLVRETSRNVWELSNLTWVEGQPWEREKMVI